MLDEIYILLDDGIVHQKAKSFKFLSLRSHTMDIEEVYLRQINEHLKRQTELQEANNELLKELLQKLGN